MKLKKIHYIGIGLGLFVILMDFLFFNMNSGASGFLFFAGVGVVIMVSPFVIDLMLENKRESDMSQMFLEFSRNLSESVATGTPISKSIINMKKKDFGPLTGNVQKLANQIELGIPVNSALKNFAFDVDNVVISRAVALIIEAERAGGEINYILDSVAKSIDEVEKLKKERKAAIYSLVVQGYIIFFIFLGIMLIMQFKIIPLVGESKFVDFSKVTDFTQTYGSSKPVTDFPKIQISNQFLYLLVTQGLFAGLAIGKLTEGSIRNGVKHSFILAVVAFLVSTGANSIFG